MWNKSIAYICNFIVNSLDKDRAVEVLLENNADRNIRNNNLKTARDLATAKGN